VSRGLIAVSGEAQVGSSVRVIAENGQMSLRLRRTFLLVAGVSGLVLASAPATAAPPALPTTTNGARVHLVASGLKTPTSFAFGDGAVFEGDAGTSNTCQPPDGGVYLLKHGQATRVPGSPQFVGGLAWQKGILYISGYSSTGSCRGKFQLLAWSGWNGSSFTKHRVVYTAPPKFQGFNGLAFGANGLLYVGIDVGLLNDNDHGPANTSPYLYDILSMKPNGRDLRVFAKGIRQPWQLAFPRGSNSPFVSDFGQDSDAVNPPDFLLRVSRGDNYGFPKCNWTKPKACQKYTKPFKLFSPHTDVGGLAIIGNRLYMSEFGFTKQHPPEVVWMPLTGGGVHVFMKNFPASIIGLGTHDGSIYVGDQTGRVYRAKP
jgi:glucose/arabinose dehydrogenase